MKRSIPFLLLLLLIISCGNSDYKFVYLKYKGGELLYIFDKDERHLCSNEEVRVCTDRYGLTGLSGDVNCDWTDKGIMCSGGFSYHYIYLADENFIIGTSYEDYIRDLIVATQDGDKIIYRTNIDSVATYANDEYISATQYPGFCDIKTYMELFSNLMSKDIPSYVDFDVTFNLESISANPDLCKLAMIFNCLRSSDLLDKVEKKGEMTINDVDKTMNCVFMAYSPDSVRLKPVSPED